MGMEVNGSGNTNNVNEGIKPQEKTVQEVKLNTIFDMDSIGNNDGTVDEEDFNIAFSKSLETSIREKVENFYIEFVANLNPKSKREVGNQIIIEVNFPLQAEGTIEKRTIVKDRNSDKILMKKSTKIVDEGEGLVSVSFVSQRFNGNNVAENKVEYQYDKEALENYIINDAKDAKGNPITRFKSIPEIKNIPENERTPEQKALLEEFDNMLKYTIDAGVKYGMDPKYILSIIQQEVGFNGLSDKVTGVNGKGYMQLTSAPVNDYLGFAGGGKYYKIKDALYGPEVEELLTSRGFNVSEAVTPSQKRVLYKNIMAYLKENKDAEFNIHLGTLVLRYDMNKADGDVTEAAKYYNGSQRKEYYSKYVTEYYTKFKDTVPNDTTYVYDKRKIFD